MTEKTRHISIRNKRYCQERSWPHDKSKTNYPVSITLNTSKGDNPKQKLTLVKVITKTEVNTSKGDNQKQKLTLVKEITKNRN